MCEMAPPKYMSLPPPPPFPASHKYALRMLYIEKNRVLVRILVTSNPNEFAFYIVSANFRWEFGRIPV